MIFILQLHYTVRFYETLSTERTAIKVNHILWWNDSWTRNKWINGTNTELTQMIMNQMCYEVDVIRLCHSEAWQRRREQVLLAGHSRSRTSSNLSRRAPQSGHPSCRTVEISRMTRSQPPSLCIWSLVSWNPCGDPPQKFLSLHSDHSLPLVDKGGGGGAGSWS